MPRGVPAAGYRMTQKRLMTGGVAKPFAVNKIVVPTVPVKTETEEEIMARLTESFASLETMTAAATTGQNRALVVSGPAGVGKSFGVSKVLDAMGNKVFATVISGHVSATGLYKTLYEYRHAKSVIVFDDADSIFNDEKSLNLLKKACDTTRKRKLHWLTETKMEDEDGERLPRSFEFEGSIIFITNYDFEQMVHGNSKNSVHFEALMSRSHYLDLGMKTANDYVVRIKQVVREHRMLRSEGFSQDEENMIIAFVEENKNRLRELSLRMVLKLASLMRISSKDWKTLAKNTCFKSDFVTV